MSCQSMSVGWFLRVLMPITLLVVVVAVPARDPVNCEQICNADNIRTYRPQDCENKCPLRGDGASKPDSDRIAAMESKVADLTVMTGVLLALVLILLVVVVMIFLHLNQKLPKMFVLPVSFRNKKNNDAKKKESAQKNCNGVSVHTNVSRLASHQSGSPQNKRPSFTRSTLGNTDLEPHPRPFRVRQPSESTCPEEGNDIGPQGYDNLGLSTSTIDANTLHNTSTESTDTLGPTVSINTLQTTLASENPVSDTHRHNTRV